MMVSSGQIIAGGWIAAGGFAIVVMVYAALKGWRHDASKAVDWRMVKVLGTLLGLLGFTSGMFAFENTIREFNKDSERYAFQRLLDLKLETSVARAIACKGDLSSQEAANECFDFTNIDNLVQFSRLRDGSLFPKMNNWQKNPHIDDILKKANNTFDELNKLMPSITEKPFLAFEKRYTLSFISLFLIASAIACSLGEAVFQLHQELLRSNKPPTSQAVAAPSSPDEQHT